MYFPFISMCILISSLKWFIFQITNTNYINKLSKRQLILDIFYTHTVVTAVAPYWTLYEIRVGT